MIHLQSFSYAINAAAKLEHGGLSIYVLFIYTNVHHAYDSIVQSIVLHVHVTIHIAARMFKIPCITSLKNLLMNQENSFLLIIVFVFSARNFGECELKSRDSDVRPGSMTNLSHWVCSQACVMEKKKIQKIKWNRKNSFSRGLCNVQPALCHAR